MRAVIAKCKSEAVKYMAENKIAREDAVVMCTQKEVDGYKDAIDEVIAVETPWMGFDLESVARQLVGKEIIEELSKEDGTNYEADGDNSTETEDGKSKKVVEKASKSKKTNTKTEKL